MDPLFTPKEIVTYVLTAVVGVLMFIVRKFDLKIRDHETHLKALDTAVHDVQIDIAKNKPDKSDLAKIDDRLQRVERTLNRIDARLAETYKGDRDD